MTAIDYLSDEGVGLLRGLDSPIIIEARLVPFNRWQLIDSPAEGGRFMEMFLPGSTRDSFMGRALSRIRGLYEHGRSRLFGRREVMRVERAWEETDAAWYRATLSEDLPLHFLDGIQRGLYSSSIGARILDAETTPNPRRSVWNPQGIEERVYRRLRVTDISLTSSPAYDLPVATVGRAAARSDGDMIYRGSLAPVRLVPDYLGGEGFDYLADRPAARRTTPDYLPRPEPAMLL